MTDRKKKSRWLLALSMNCKRWGLIFPIVPMLGNGNLVKTETRKQPPSGKLNGKGKEEGNRTRGRVWKRNREIETEIETMEREREIRSRREASKQTWRVTAPGVSRVDQSSIPKTHTSEGENPRLQVVL